MEFDAEFDATLRRTEGACSWKCLQRRLSPGDRLFEAGDLACRVRFHKYICDAQSYSNVVADIHTLSESVATLLSSVSMAFSGYTF